MTLRIDPAPVEDTTPVDWLRDGVDFGRAVARWMPGGFDAYARILHPAHSYRELPNGDVVGEQVRWSGVSEWSGRPLHRASSFHELSAGPDGGSWSGRGRATPFEGQLEQPLLDRLIASLIPATKSPQRLWLLVWAGYGQPHSPALRISQSLTNSGRDYFLHRGSLDLTSGDLGRLQDEPPSMWWPDDRAWFVSTDIDISSTYVGGPSALIGQILGDELLETFPAYLDDPYDGPPQHMTGGPAI